MLFNIACFCVLALLAVPEKEKSLGRCGKLLQLRPNTSQGGGRHVQFDVRSSGDEEIAEPTTSKTLSLGAGWRPTVESDTERHAMDPFVASKYGLVCIRIALLLFLCGGIVSASFCLFFFLFSFSLFFLLIVGCMRVICCVVLLLSSCIEATICPL